MDLISDVVLHQRIGFHAYLYQVKPDLILKYDDKKVINDYEMIYIRHFKFLEGF